ncbi:hypothetical protein L1987_32687 [Smallanthus sonchifolius]|uniref:Uncharacterized protein n=1 Tax=Smallanthus sonchifolius TaxID=185202 RepID=A0ACB9HNY9_9ASTR|nr:hypothetical protein L1987_32687 [Smallanthus sonchifolius]
MILSLIGNINVSPLFPLSISAKSNQLIGFAASHLQLSTNLYKTRVQCCPTRKIEDRKVRFLQIYRIKTMRTGQMAPHDVYEINMKYTHRLCIAAI